MNSLKTLAVALIIAGALALLYGGFSYTRPAQVAKVGPIELTVNETHTVNFPLWAGIAAIVAGGALLVVGRRS